MRICNHLIIFAENKQRYMPRRSEAEVLKLKPKVMEALVKSGYNMASVSKKYGVSRSTLKIWRDEYEATADLSHEVTLVKQEAAISFEQMRSKVAKDNLEKLNTLLQDLVKRASELAPNEPDIARISVAMRATTEALKVLTAVDMEGKDATTSTQQTINLFQQTIYQLNQNEQLKGRLIGQ